MKKLFSLLLVAALLIGLLAACGEQKAAPTGGESGEGSGLIGVCMQNMSSSIAELESAALTETFEALGYEVQVVSADDSVSNQVQQIQNFILMDAEMLVVLPCEIETLEDTLLEAREAGIKVVISGGTGTISEDAYDAVSADDEYMIGMYVASVAKTWVEEHMDADGDWHVAFLSSTISDDAKSRCAGEAQILEPWLKNEAGEYVNLMGEVVSEAERIENPVYCEMIAERVTNLADCTTEMDISGDNRSVVAGVLTDDPNVRVIIAYNSLVSTAGSQYIMDTYPEDEQDEFAFFSGGVMGDEYEYLIGAVSETSGTKSVFRGACQFGGGDAAATLANLAYNVMFGEAGVDYGKSNPNSIGLYFPIDAELNGGNAALVCFDTSPYIESFTYEEVLARENLMVYWDELNESFPARTQKAGEVVLEARDLTGNSVEHISFQLHMGEILGFAGLVGSGRSETMELISGAKRPDSGEILINGRKVSIGSPASAIRHGIGLIPEDRKEQGVILHNTVQFNISLSSMKKLTRLGFISGRRNSALAEKYRGELRIKVPGVKQMVVNLSGGNQQKVALAKALAADPDIIIFDEPTKGIDVGAKQEIYQLMNDLVESGKAIIMVSSDMEEILGMSDRIIVLHEGLVSGELMRGEFSQERVLQLASGV